MYMYLCVCMWGVYMCVGCVYVYMYLYVHTCRVLVYVCVCICMQGVCIYVYVECVYIWSVCMFVVLVCAFGVCVCVFVHFGCVVCVHAYMKMQIPTEASKLVDSAEVSVTGSCEPPDVSAGNQELKVHLPGAGMTRVFHTPVIFISVCIPYALPTCLLWFVFIVVCIL